MGGSGRTCRSRSRPPSCRSWGASTARPRRCASPPAATRRCSARSRSCSGGHDMTHARRRLELRGAIALVAAIAIPMGVFAASATGAPAAAAAVRLTGLTPHVPPGAIRVAAVDAAQPLSFSVVLGPSNPGELASLVRDQYDPASPRYAQWLAPGEYQQRFGPSPDRVAAVVDWLHDAGLTDTQVVDGRVDVRTTTGRAAAALGVSIARFRLGDGEERTSAEQAP